MQIQYKKGIFYKNMKTYLIEYVSIIITLNFKTMKINIRSKIKIIHVIYNLNVISLCYSYRYFAQKAQ